VDPRAGLDAEAGAKILSPPQAIEFQSPGRPVCIQALYQLSYPGSALGSSVTTGKLRCEAGTLHDSDICKLFSP
jgi:hypothetical protein